MSELTVKGMDAIINAVSFSLSAECATLPLDRAMFLAGMKAGAGVKHEQRAALATTEHGMGWNCGHDSHQVAIFDTLKRLKLEMK